MRTLLLCGYRYDTETALGLERDASGETLIDRRIRQLQDIGIEPVAVLSGPLADEQLRECTRLAGIEIAFDTNETATTLSTNLKAGLTAAVGEACFVLPVEIPCPEPEAWECLKKNLRRLPLESQISLVQALTPQGALYSFGFPLAVTRFGNAEIRRLSELKTLLDTRLKYLHIVYPEVASSPKDL
jgi:molybdopterin-guanine dinucleotide biosynthesis protein A